MLPITLLSFMIITYFLALFELSDQSFNPMIDYQSRKQIAAPPLSDVDSIIHIHPFVSQLEQRVDEIRLESLTFHDAIFGFISMIAVFNPFHASLLLFVTGYYHHYNDMTLARQIQIAQALRTGPPSTCSPIDFKQSSIVKFVGMFMKDSSIDECFNHYQIINQSQSPNPFIVFVSFISTTFEPILHHLGSSIGQFIKALLGKLTWFESMFATMVTSIMIASFITSILIVALTLYVYKLRRCTSISSSS